MDETAIRRVCDNGLESAPATRDLEAWCWDHAEATGDARFCGLARALGQVADTWDAYGALPANVAADIAAVFAQHLPDILDVSTPEEGAGLARLLREDVIRILQQWGGRF